MFYAQIVKQYITSISNNNSQGNSAIVKAAKELNEGIHKGGTKYWQWYGFNGRVEWCAILFLIMLKKLELKWNILPIAQLVLKILKRITNGLGKEVCLKWEYHLFDWDGDSISYYVGIVEKVENEVVYTIEENSGNKIAKLSYEKIALISWVMVFRKQHIFLNKCLIISTFLVSISFYSNNSQFNSLNNCRNG